MAYQKDTIEKLYERMDKMVDAGYSREEVLKHFDSEIKSVARSIYMTHCYYDSLSDEEWKALQEKKSTKVSSWLENGK